MCYTFHPHNNPRRNTDLDRLIHSLKVRQQEHGTSRTLTSAPRRSIRLIPTGRSQTGAVDTSMRVLKALIPPQNSTSGKPHINQRWLPRCVGIRAEKVSQTAHHSPERRQGWGLSFWELLGGCRCLSALRGSQPCLPLGQGGDPSLPSITSTGAPGQKGLNCFGSLPNS